MLYVFHVDAGTMATFDMNIALQSVAYLKQAIEKKTKIPAGSLVLLVSGGGVLQGDEKVSSYSAGTDTNPIFMFSKPSIMDENAKQPNYHSDDYECPLSPISELRGSVEVRGAELKAADMKPLVEACGALPPCLATVTRCAQLAQQFGDVAGDYARSCQQLVHDQHLQHQGWTAVIANLEDIYKDFCERCFHFKESFKLHRDSKEKYQEQLKSLDSVLQELGKIPMLPALQVNAETHRFTAFDEFDDEHCYAGAYSHAGPLDGSDNRGSADFGVHPFKMSQDDVFVDEKPWPDARSSGSAQAQAECEGAPVALSESDEGVTFKAPSYDGREEYTLLQWITAKGNRASLEDIIDYCHKGLKLMDADPAKDTEAELYKMLEFANTHGLKQIKGIESRLYGLDELIAQVRRTEREQAELANALLQSCDRVSSSSDPSVLPTLCSSHRLLLHSMLKKHENLVDLHRRIAKSKDELSVILKARLGTVLKIENLLSKQDAHQMLNFQCFNRLARYFDVVSQLHRAPELFARAVHEVARRRLFSDAFLQWASELACHLLTIHNDEVVRRQEFNAQFRGHFLSALFPGTEDMPPTFAAQAPHDFDARLPRLTDLDVEYVTRTFPDLARDIDKCNMESVVEFFRSRMGPSAKFGKKEQGLTEMVQAGLERGFDSETETAEPEKPSGEKERTDASTACQPDTAAVSTLTEVRCPPSPLPVIPERSPSRDEFEHSEFYIEESLPTSLEWGRDERQENMDSHKLSIAKLTEFLISLYQLCRKSMVFVQEELSKLRSDVEEQRQLVRLGCLEIQKAWTRSNEEWAQRTREETQKLTFDHELELSDIKKVLTEKDDAISSLQDQHVLLRKEHACEIENLHRSHENTKSLLERGHEEYKALEKKIEDMDVQKQKEMKELQDKMHLEYKAEIESLRSRFRLVALTNMDRSPSESSLEKIERTDMIEITSHNSIVLQTKENMEVEKEAAVREAVERCEGEWRRRHDEQLEKIRNKYEAEKQVTLNEAVRRIIDEKDRQLEQSREREMILLRECTKYKETIQQLSDPDTNDYETLLKSQVATLENEKAALAVRLDDLERELERRSSSEPKEPEKAKEEDADVSTSPPCKESREEKPSRMRAARSHTPLGLAPGTLSLSSCLPGHRVVVLWDPGHQNYTVLQEAPVMFFVHSDSLAALELSLVATDAERRLYTVATVESKEYCYAKKSGNRYRVPRGTRFYQVRVRPCRGAHAPPACCEHRHARRHDTQKSQETSQSTSSATDASEMSCSVAVEPVAAPLCELEESTAVCTDDEGAPDWRTARLGEWEGEEETEAAAAAEVEEAPAPLVSRPFALALPLELTVSTQSIAACTESHAVTHALADLVESEIAEEATP